MLLSFVLTRYTCVQDDEDDGEWIPSSDPPEPCIFFVPVGKANTPIVYKVCFMKLTAVCKCCTLK